MLNVFPDTVESRLSGLFLWTQFGHEYLLVTIKIRSHIFLKLQHLKVQSNARVFVLKEQKQPRTYRLCTVEKGKQATWQKWATSRRICRPGDVCFRKPGENTDVTGSVTNGWLFFFDPKKKKRNGVFSKSYDAVSMRKWHEKICLSELIRIKRKKTTLTLEFVIMEFYIRDIDANEYVTEGWFLGST